MKQQVVMGYQGDPLQGYFWDEVAKPKAVVQIIHGMQEHAKRYDEFAKYLNKKGYIVFASDLRGHGETAGSIENLGVSDGDIFEEIVNDQMIIANTLSQKYDLPLYAVGHSFGSFVTQMLITKTDMFKKVVLSGSAYTKNSAFRMGLLVANVNGAFVGYNKKAKFLEKNSFGAYAKKFKDRNWLTRDEDIFKAYVLDPYCGVSFPYSFYRSFFKGARKNYKDIDNISKDLKLFIISGDKDPIGGYGRLATKLYNKYRKRGIDAECKLYNGARHEILNETNRHEVYSDVVKFFDK